MGEVEEAPTSPEDSAQEFLSMAHGSPVLLEVIFAEVFVRPTLPCFLPFLPTV